MSTGQCSAWCLPVEEPQAEPPTPRLPRGGGEPLLWAEVLGDGHRGQLCSGVTLGRKVVCQVVTLGRKVVCQVVSTARGLGVSQWSCCLSGCGCEQGAGGAVNQARKGILGEGNDIGKGAGLGEASHTTMTPDAGRGWPADL